MVNKILNSVLGAVFSQDPSITLYTYLSTNWTAVTGYTPPAANLVKFDTKFGAMKGFYNWVIVEKMVDRHKAQTLGQSRFDNEVVRRLQVMCKGPSARNNRYIIEKHIESLLNGNVTGMQADGIKTVMISDFQEIPTQSDSDVTRLKPTKDDHVRSFATVVMKYDSEIATI